MTLRSFYDLLWNRDAPLHSRVHLEMLVGEARPAAFVEVATSQACEAVNAAPLLRPRSPNVSYLVSNLDAVSARRSELAEVHRLSQLGQLNAFHPNIVGDLLALVDTHTAPEQLPCVGHCCR